MTFRVTNIGTTNAFIEQILNTRRDLEESREEISSGYKILDASDDPGRAGTVASLIATSQRIDRHSDRITFATSYLEAQEGAVQSANNVMIRLQELAEQAANDTNTQDVREQIADEVFQLRDALGSIANTKYQDLHVFGGLKDTTEPVTKTENYFSQPPTADARERVHWDFDRDPITADYGAARQASRTVKISDNESIRINTPATTIFEDAINAATVLGRALMGYQTVSDTTDADTDGNTTEPAVIQPAQLTLPADIDIQKGEINRAIDALRDARVNSIEVELSSIGARVNRLEQTAEILETLKLNTEKSRAAIQEADPFESATKFSLLQTSLEALLASGSQINNLSLLNFI